MFWPLLCFNLQVKSQALDASYWDLDGAGMGGWSRGQKFQDLSGPKSPVTALPPHLYHEVLSIFRLLIWNLGIV